MNPSTQLAFDGASFGPNETHVDLAAFPPTRYQGSKRKLLTPLASAFQTLEFDTALDVFGGTGSVSSLLRRLGKHVTYNDYLRSNSTMVVPMLASNGEQLETDDLEFILAIDPEYSYKEFIQVTFDGVFFTTEENKWLDTVAQNIPRLPSDQKRSIAYFALFQSCLIKRPYNLFHRKNLYMRLSEVDRTFGNKTSWDTPFVDHFVRFLEVANQSAKFTTNPAIILNSDAREIQDTFDLVYLDPPYLNAKGAGIDYLDFYHFLEGLVEYERWPERINYNRKHLPISEPKSDWSNPKFSHGAFMDLFQSHSESTIVVSYRNDGYPSREELKEMLQSVKSNVEIRELCRNQYALSTNRATRELLFIGR